MLWQISSKEAADLAVSRGHKRLFDNFLALSRILKTKVSESRLPLKLTLGLTYRCQGNCSYCNIWRFYRDSPSECTKEIPANVYKEMFRELRDDLSWLNLTGGEPFLRSDIEDIAGYALNNTRVKTLEITTNGLDPSAVLEKVHTILLRSEKKTVIVGVSIDGTPEVYERARGVDGFNNALQSFMGLKQLSERFDNLHPHIAYTITRFNSGSFPSFFDFLSNRINVDVRELSFALEHAFGYYFKKEPAQRRKDDTEFLKNVSKDVESILGHLRESGGSHFSLVDLARRLFYNSYLENIPKYLADPSHQIIPCKACELSAYVDPYGVIYPCIMWKRPLGNLRDSDFVTIWKSDRRREAMRDIEAGRCPVCWTPCEAQQSWLAKIGFPLIRDAALIRKRKRGS